MKTYLDRTLKSFSSLQMPQLTPQLHFMHSEWQQPQLHSPLCAEKQDLFNVSVSAFYQAKTTTQTEGTG